MSPIGQHLLLQDRVPPLRLKLPPEYLLKIGGAVKVIVMSSPVHSLTSEGLIMSLILMFEQLSQTILKHQIHV